MNTKSFRREVLIGVGGFVAGGLAMSLALALWPQRPLGVQVTHSASGINSVVAPTPPEVSFRREFRMIGLQSPVGDETGLTTAEPAVRVPQRPARRLDLFDLPRQQPWVAPYEFLIHPDQRR